MYGAHLDLQVLTHSFPTLRSSVLSDLNRGVGFMRKCVLLLAVSTSTLAVAVPSHAQETQERPRIEEGDIIVTARKRQESVLRVPVVETVLSQEALSKAQVTDVTGIANQVAGLQVGSNVLTVGTQISLRGVGTSSLDAGVDQSVSLNIDGLQLTQGATYGAIGRASCRERVCQYV